MRYIITIMNRALIKTISCDGFEFAGYLTFLIILSIFPILLSLINICSLFHFTEISINILINRLPVGLHGFEERITEIIHNPAPFSIINLFNMIWVSSYLIEGITKILDRIYNFKYNRSYLFRKLVSILQSGLVILLSIMILFFFIVVPIILNLLNQFTDIRYTIITYHPIIQLFIIFLIFFLFNLFAYYLLPNGKMILYEVLPGSIFSSLAYIITNKIYSIYIDFTHINTYFIYGSLASIVITLIYLFILSFIFIYGGALNYCIYCESRK